MKIASITPNFRPRYVTTRFRVLSLWAGLLLLALSQPLRGQDPASLTLTELLARVDGLTKAGNYSGARPIMIELVDRYKDESEATRANLEPLYYYIGVSFLQDYSADPKDDYLEEAVRWFNRHQSEFPLGNNAVRVLFGRADARRGLGDLARAAVDYEKLLKAPFTGRTSAAEDIEALENLVGCYYQRRAWARGEPWFLRYFQEARDDEQKAKGAVALIESYISQNKTEEMLNFLPFIVGSASSRYQLQFNLALIDAGDRFSKAKEFNKAMLMYRLTLSLEELLVWHDAKLADLQQQLKLLKITSEKKTERSIELETEIFNEEAQLKALNNLKPKSYTPSLKMRIARNYLQTGRDWEGFWAFNRLIEENPNSPEIEDFFYSAFSSATSIDFVDRVIGMGEDYLNNPQWSKFKSDISVKLCEFYLRKEDYQSFFELAKKFINENSKDRYASQVVYLMGSTLMKLEQYGEMASLFTDYTKTYKGAQMLDGCYYWGSMGSFFQRDYQKSIELFTTLLGNYQQSPYREDAQYRIGICKFGMEDYNGAKADFERFIKDFPNSELRGEAEFFLGDIYSVYPDVPNALKHYALVEKYTNNITYIQSAYFQSGELLYEAGRYQEMEEIYRRFIDRHSDFGDVTEAIFQVGRALELQDKPDEMLKSYAAAVVKYGDDSRLYGLDRIITILPERYEENLQAINQNLSFLKALKEDEALLQGFAASRESIFEYFAENPLIREEIKEQFYYQTYVDGLLEDMSPLDKWVELYEGIQANFPTDAPADTLGEIYTSARDAGEQTLQYRAHMVLAQIGADPDPDYIFSVDDFDYGSPASLIWMGTRAFEFDPETSRQAYQRVIDEHPDSSDVFTAMLKLGELDEELEDYSSALYYYRQAEAFFPGEDDIVTALIKQGDVLRKQREFLEAREVYKRIFNNRLWRGGPHAEAYYKSGLVFRDEKRAADALSYFERVYVGYIANTEWAVRSYLAAGELLVLEGKAKEARALYEECISSPILQGSPVLDEVKSALRAL